MSTMIEIDAATSDRLDSIARELRVTRAYALQRAIKALEYELAFRQDVEAGLRELDEGKFLSGEEVDAYFASKRASLLESIGK